MKRFLAGTGLLFSALVGTAARAEEFNRSTYAGEALEGYDPVAYFKEGVAKAGSRAYLYEWKGVEWRFASAEDMALFRQEPERYAPAYGGYCAYAMSKGIRADIHPYAFLIQNGRLFLFATFESRDQFRANSEIKQGAEANWSKMAAVEF